MKLKENRACDRRKVALLHAAGVAAVFGVVASTPGVAKPVTPSTPAAAVGSDIVVTARKREERLKDVPISITALGGNQLTAIGAENFEDYANRVPGLSFSTRGPTSSRAEGVTLSIRGVNGGLSDPPVSFYIDDTPVGSINLKLFDIDRVEILKGPQGTLYGARALGGLIKVETRKAKLDAAETTGGIELSDTKGGGFNFRADAAVNLPLVENKLALRITGYGLHREGTIDRLPGAQNLPEPYLTSVPEGALRRNEDDERTYGGRASLLFSPDSALKLIAGYIFEKAKVDARSEWDVPVSQALGRNLISGAFAAEPSTAEFHNASLTASYDLGDFASIQSNTSQTWYKVQNKEDFTYFLKAILSGFGAGWNEPTTNIYQNDRNIFTQELRMSSSGHHNVDWQVGLFYQHTRQTGTFDWSAPGVSRVINDALGFAYVANDLLIDQKSLSITRELGAFGELNWNIADKLTFTAGGRYFRNTFHNRDERVGLLAAPTSILRSKDDGINPHFALAYKPGANLLVYGSTSKGFRRGGANNIVAIPASCNAEIKALGYDSAPATFQSDNLWHYEVGAKGNTRDGSLSFEAAAFRIDWKNQQQNVFLPQCGFNLGANIGRSTIDGFELSATLRPSERLSVDMSVGYLDARVGQDTPQAGAVKGDRLPLAPPWTVSSSIAYEVPISERKSFFSRADLTYRDKVIEPTTRQTLDDFVTVNVRAGVKLDRYTLTVFVDNLNNTLGQLDAVGTGLLIGQPGALRIHTLTPRTIGAELRLTL